MPGFTAAFEGRGTQGRLRVPPAFEHVLSASARPRANAEIGTDPVAYRWSPLHRLLAQFDGNGFKRILET